MTKYIVIETFEVMDKNPYWHERIGSIEPRYVSDIRSNVLRFADSTSLSNYLSKHYSSTSHYEVFEVSREVVPVVETKTLVSFK